MNFNRPIKVKSSGYNHSRSKGHKVLWGVFALSMTAVFAAVLAFAWQQAAPEIYTTSQSDASQSTSSVVSSVPDEPSSDGSSSAPAADEPQSSDAAQSADASAHIGIVPKSELTDSTYFDDAVFMGDSLTSGIQLYELMKNTTVFAKKGINMLSIFNETIPLTEEGPELTIFEALAQTEAQKVYIMLGHNELAGISKEAFLKRYTAVVEEIKRVKPKVVLYVQSMTPVTVDNRYKLTNEKIDEYNGYIQEMCAEQKVHYLNVAEAFKNEDGALPTEASPADGLHFGPDYYSKWFEYLKTHVVQ